MTTIRRETLAIGDLTFSMDRAGTPGGDVVVCLHGFPDTSATFRHQLAALADAGFDALAPTLRGYEPGSQPADGDYDVMTLAGDVIGWLDALDVERAHLVGHDWGAVITYVVAAHHPERLLSATALAIPPLPRIPDAVRRVPRQLLRSWYMTWFQVRGIADRSARAADWRLIRRLWRSWSPGYEMTDDEWVGLRATFEQPGVLPAALAYYRQNATPPLLLGLRTTPAMAPTPIRVPVLIAHGADDGCMDRRLFAPSIHLEDFPAGVEHVEIPDAGHFLQLERPDAVTDLILDHLAAATP